MSKATTILAKDPEIPAWVDFDQLRKEGIRHIAELSGDIWTDHNLHDPGITILEVLCYALADLGYRNNLSIEDLLAQKTCNGTVAENNFFTAAEALSCNPLTILDYRKMLMNIKGIRNAWLEPVVDEEALLPSEKTPASECEKVYLNGLYKVILELDVFAEGKERWEQSGEVDNILTNAETLLHSHRNLCEDFLEIFVLNDEEIGIAADIEIVADANPDEVMLNILVNLQVFLSPTINYYTLGQLLEKKKNIEDVFLGRPHKTADLAPSQNQQSGLSGNFGFVDTEELEAVQRKTELHASDFYREIMKTKGVKAVRNLKLFNFMDGVQQTTGEEWCLKLTPRHRPVISAFNSKLRFFKNTLLFTPDKEKAARLFRDKIAGLSKTVKQDDDIDRAVPQGQFRPDLGEFYSIQHEFPLTYRIGKDELPTDASEQRRMQKFQLKGYLLFFDQLLANYLAQVANLRDLFAHSGRERTETYFSQGLENVPELESLLRYFDEGVSNFSQNEVIANSTASFSTYEQRDLAIQRIIGEFEQGTIVTKKLPLNGGFSFIVLGNNKQEILKSITYPSSGQAEQAAEAINFLGTLQQCYHLTDDTENQAYSFNLVHNPVQYLAYLKQITETQEAAEQRRTRFLDHLLARFSEEFSDYTLLMYALEGKRREESKIIKDKEFFLSNYPALSRNRGRGFNYLKPFADGNSSGFEQRVKALMGMGKQQQGSLSNMEIAEWRPLYFAEIRNCSDKVIFEGTTGRAKESETQADAIKIKSLAKSRANYIKWDCEAEGLFGFQLAENGKPAARHPATYGSAERRDEKIENLVSLAVAQSCYLVKTVPTEQGAWFTLFDDSKKPIFKNKMRYPTVMEAHDAWHRFMQLAADPNNYRLEESQFCSNFSFSVMERDTSGNNVPIAAHTEWYCTRKARANALKRYQDYFGGKKLVHEIQATDGFFNWQLSAGPQSLLLENLPRFRSVEQAVANCNWLLEIGKNENVWHDRYNEEDGYHAFFIKEEKGYEAARSPWFKTAKERDHAKKTAMDWMAGGGDGPSQTSDGPAFKVTAQPGSFFIQIFDADGKLALEGKQFYASKKEAQWAFYKLTKSASALKNYALVKEEGSCRYGFLIPTEECGPRAVHPIWYESKHEAKRALKKLVAFIDENSLHFQVGFTEKSWHGEVLWENCEGRLAPLLVGKERRSEADAERDANTWIETIKNNPGKLEKTDNENCYGFQLGLWDGDKKYKVRHPVKYADAISRNKAFEKAKSLLTTSKEWVGTAVVKTFPNHSTLRTSIVAAQNGTGWCFLLWANEGSLVLWQSAIIFKSQEEAAKALESQLPKLIELSKNEEDYQIEAQPNSKWKLTLLDKSKNPIAEPFALYDSENAALNAKKDRILWAGVSYGYRLVKNGPACAAHPVVYRNKNNRDEAFRKLIRLGKACQLPYSKLRTFLNTVAQNGGDWRFFLSDEVESPALWQSATVFPSPEKAGQALDFQLVALIELSKNGENYHIETQPHCKWKLTLLDEMKNPIAEAPILFASKEAAHCAKDDRILWAKTYPVFKKYDRFWFRVVEAGVEEDTVLWQSVASFLSQEDAGQALDFQLFALIELSKNDENYRIEAQPHCKWKLTLLDEKKKPIAEAPILFASKEAAHCAKDDRILWARIYPIFEKCGRFMFRVVETGVEEDTVLWQSVASYADRKGAEEAFRKFLHLASYPGNYHKKDNVCAARFEIELREVLLESVNKNTTEAEAWREANEFVLQADQQGAFYKFVSHETGCPSSGPHPCRHGFRIVGERYILSRHNRRYHTIAKQQDALERLYAEAQCRAEKRSNLSIGFCRKREDVYFNIINSDDQRVLWRSAKSFSIGDGRLEENVENFLFGNDTMPPENRNYYLDLYEYARHADFYIIIQESADRFRLGLQNPDGDLALLSEETRDTKEGCQLLATELIRIFRLFPVLKEGEDYHFQYYTFDEHWTGNDTAGETTGITDTGLLLWESRAPYTFPAMAEEAFDRFVGLLGDKSNFQPSTEADGRYFSVEITDPAAALATHPLTYVSETERDEAIGLVTGNLNNEGFHIVEHILLRPKDCATSNGGLIQGCTGQGENEIHYQGNTLVQTNCGKVQEEPKDLCFVPNADAYSFWLTVVLPYWPERFQSNQFRKFFENTLRREAPAHVALRILWVGPGDMAMFESKYQSWLLANGQEESCDLCGTQASFVKFLFEQIRQGNPGAILDGPVEDNGVVLDETRLAL